VKTQENPRFVPPYAGIDRNKVLERNRRISCTDKNEHAKMMLKGHRIFLHLFYEIIKGFIP